MELKRYEIYHILNLIEQDERLELRCKCDKVYWSHSDIIKEKLNNELNKV